MDLAGFFRDLGDALSQGWDAVFSRHETIQQVYSIDGSMSRRCRCVLCRGTRLTYNINFNEAWRGDTWVHVVVANVPEGQNPCAMAVQQKYDEDWDDDPNIGPVLRHGDFVSDSGIQTGASSTPFNTLAEATVRRRSGRNDIPQGRQEHRTELTIFEPCMLTASQWDRHHRPMTLQLS